MVETAPSRLTAEDWLNAALAAFESGGVDAVKVESLAKVLKVTRGSFYWHFEDRSDLLRRLLMHWEAIQTHSIISTVETHGGNASQRLLRLLETCARDEGRLELALRGWANTDDKAHAAIAKIDKHRIGYIADLLMQAGIDKREALANARVAYSAWLGEYSQPTTPTYKARLENMRSLHRLLLARRT